MKRDVYILFLNGRAPPPLNVGGDGVSIDIFLKILQKRGYPVECHGVINPHFNPKTIDDGLKILEEKEISYEYNKNLKSVSYDENYPVTAHTEIDLANFLKEYKKKHSKMVIITQLDLACDILGICLRENIPILVFIRDAQENNFLTTDKIKKTEKRVYIAFNSEYTREKFREVEKYINTSVIYPPLVFKKIKTLKFNPQFITMINPVGVKGGSIFKNIATRFPNEQFLAVKGWYNPINDHIDFSRLANVTVWEKQEDIRNVYAVTKLLLVPSQWEEGFGRVAAEGLVAGIPVLASKNAGLTSALGNIGYYVAEYKSVQAWVKQIKAILKMPNKKLSQHIIRGQNYAKRFDADLLVSKLEKIINEIA